MTAHPLLTTVQSLRVSLFRTAPSRPRFAHGPSGVAVTLRHCGNRERVDTRGGNPTPPRCAPQVRTRRRTAESPHCAFLIHTSCASRCTGHSLREPPYTIDGDIFAVARGRADVMCSTPPRRVFPRPDEFVRLLGIFARPLQFVRRTLDVAAIPESLSSHAPDRAQDQGRRTRGSRQPNRTGSPGACDRNQTASAPGSGARIFSHPWPPPRRAGEDHGRQCR